jgi:hypothetical protein
VKLPVSSWTAAEAANLLLIHFDHIRLLSGRSDGSRDQEAMQAVFLPENAGKGRL